MTSEQMSEWEAYDVLEPFGSPRLDWLTGLVCSTVANFSEISRKHNYTSPDFVPSPVELLKKKAKTLSQQILDRFQFLTGKKKG